MIRNIIIIYFFFYVLNIFALQSPHGKNLKLKCSECHTTDTWNNVQLKDFDHKKTKFPLVGQHKTVDCKSCHKSLVFSDASTECISCHTDIHQQTNGTDCARCHTPESWLVQTSTIKIIHQQSGFPLIGAHATADCNRCHTSGSKLRYEVLNTECYACHRDKYEATTNPNHRNSGFSTDCYKCHNMSGSQWNGTKNGFEHGFFPLNGGHNLECTQCHINGDYSGLSKTCVSCHQADYNATTQPAHASSGFSTECQSCHSISAWKPANFDHDKKYFPINSGTHRGTWDACSTCHTNPSNYSAFTCLNCHEHNKTSMDAKHRGRSGYSYNSSSCYSCHPRGKAD